MTPKEVQDQILVEIQLAKNQVLPWFDQTLSVRTWLPLHDRWSIDEILHHITLTSHYLLILIDKASNKCLKAKARGETLDWPATYSLIPEALRDAGAIEAFTWHRPDHMDPRTYPATGDVRALFLAQMDRCEKILETLEGGWGHWSLTTMSVNDLGKIDVYQFIVFLCKHAQRHCMQMAGNLAVQAAQ